jgi:hypothetical protein
MGGEEVGVSYGSSSYISEHDNFDQRLSQVLIAEKSMCPLSA